MMKSLIPVFACSLVPILIVTRLILHAKSNPTQPIQPYTPPPSRGRGSKPLAPINWRIAPKNATVETLNRRATTLQQRDPHNPSRAARLTEIKDELSRRGEPFAVASRVNGSNAHGPKTKD